MHARFRLDSRIDNSTILLIIYIIVSVLTWALFHYNLILSNHAIWGNELGDIKVQGGSVSFVQRIAKDLILLILFAVCSKGFLSLKKWYEEVFIGALFAACLWSSYLNGWIVSISGVRSFIAFMTLYLYIKTTGVNTISKIAQSKFLWIILFSLTCLEILFANAQLSLWISRNGLSSFLYYRAFGTFPTVFELCDFCTGVSFLSSILIVLNQKNNSRNWILLFLSIILTFYTGSRSSILVGMMNIILMGLYRLYGWNPNAKLLQRKKITLDLLLMIIFICLALFAILPIIQNLIGRGDLIEGQGRSEILVEAFSAPISTILFGNGLGRSSRSLGQLAAYLPDIKSIYIYSDSTINFFMVDLGIVGCLIFFLLSIPFLRMVLKLFKLHPIVPLLILPPIIITALARNLLELYILIPLVVFGLCTCIDYFQKSNPLEFSSRVPFNRLRHQRSL
jgi:hypothetical protein